MSDAENDRKWKVLQAKVQERKVRKAFELFEEIDVEPILIKGFASSRFYPKDVGRMAVDVDLCVPPAEFEKCQEFIEGVSHQEANIDLHRGFRHHDSLTWEELFENSELVEADGKHIRILCPEDHLRVLCVHWLTDGGEYKEKLWDIFYAVENRQNDFDWDKCLSVVSERRRFWVICVIGLAHHYFDLNIEGLPFEEEAKNIPKWLIKEVKKHWDEDFPIIPLESCKHDRELFWKQLRKRIPPNPIYATISMEGSLAAKTRVFYQIGNMFQRFVWSFKRVFNLQ